MRYVLSIATLLVMFAACKKAETPVSREDELRAGKWKLSVQTLRYDPYIGLDTTFNLLAAQPDCKRDDYIVFKANFDAGQNSGASKCSGADPDEIAFRWELYDNGAGIHFWNANETFFGQSTLNMPFVNYTSSRFTVRDIQYTPSPADNTQKDTLTFTYTYVKF